VFQGAVPTMVAVGVVEALEVVDVGPMMLKVA
jgi:hypothetical protein